MISALHLLWIIPLAASFGCVVCAILAVGRMSDPHDVGDDREGKT